MGQMATRLELTVVRRAENVGAAAKDWTKSSNAPRMGAERVTQEQSICKILDCSKAPVFQLTCIATDTN